MAEKRTERVAAKAPTRAKRTMSRRRPKKGTPTHEEIATRAYYIAQESEASDPLHDWLHAENELRAA